MIEKFVTRRKFLHFTSLSTVAMTTGLSSVFANEVMTPQLPLHKGSFISITPDPDTNVFKPLDMITVNGLRKGTVQVFDGNGNLYLSKQADGAPFSYRAGGALGIQTVLLLNRKGQPEDWASYKIDAKTELKDKGARYEKLLATLYWTMGRRGVGRARFNGKFYEYFVSSLRDHVHVMKAMKYFYPNLKSAIELYSDYQLETGMLHEFINSRPQGKRTTWWEKRMESGPYMLVSDDGAYELKRFPVENDVEYLFVEGVYYTWKATGDTEWMKGLLDKMLKAIEYATTDPYRWSTKYQLLKRGFTIDTWDFQSSFDLSVVGGDIFVVDKDKSQFGVMFGDNTGMAIGLSFLAEMLETAGRSGEAKRMRQLEKELRERLDKLSWNGDFFRHHVPENPDFKRDTGTDHEKQVSLSNAYSLNRGITHEQAVAIIKTYQRIRREMPKSSPGEWYGIYPPFERGFDEHSKPWEYVNGGVLSIVAGELAHGAFEHGYETYGVETLNRVADLALTTSDYLHCAYKGAMPDKPVRNFTTLSLAAVANGDIRGEGAKGVRGWFRNDPNDDFRNLPVGLHSYQEIPFEVVDPAANDGKCCLLLADSGENYAGQIILPVGRKAASVYYLHASNGSTDVGKITFEYSDGSTAIDSINNRKIADWYMPNDRISDNCLLGWWGANGNFTNIGCVVYGYNNPYPDREIKSLRFNSPGGDERSRNEIEALLKVQASREARQSSRSAWGVLAVTLCDSPVFFMPDTVSFGIPDNWGAAAVAYALLEGLVGVKDTGVSFDKAHLAPRWEAAGVSDVEATVKYEASGGYLSYKYSKTGNDFNILFTGNGKTFDVEILLPKNASVKSVTMNDSPQSFRIRKTEESAYCCFTLDGIGVKDINIINNS